MFYKNWNDGNTLSITGEISDWMKVPLTANKLYKINTETEVKNMESLYQVFVIDKKKNFIVNDVVVAKTDEDAKFELQVTEEVRAKGLKLSDVTVIVHKLGSVKVEEEK